MRVLVVSRAPWREDNSIGNTFSDFFRDFPDAEFYSLSMREQAPQNSISKRNFYISEKQLVKHILGKKTPVGAENTSDSRNDVSEKKMYDAAKNHSSYFLYFARELVWSAGGWKNDNLRNYIQEIDPDVIFFPVFGCFYPHKILRYIHKITDASIVLFHADDNYTLRQFSVSPLYWLYRFILRKWVRNSVGISDVNYVISDVQKVDYERSFKRECKVLTKFSDFSEGFKPKDTYNDPLQLVFTGNVSVNRWRSLGLIAEVLKKINADEIKAELRIYTGTPLTEKMSKALNVQGASYVMGSVPSSEIPGIQKEADILVHAEAMDLKNKLAVRQSFSTKLVDYMKSCRPILAVGPKDVASIKHLADNKCALTADSADELYEKLISVLNSKDKLDELADKAYICGAEYHDKAKMSAMLVRDFCELSNKCGNI